MKSIEFAFEINWPLPCKCNYKGSYKKEDYPDEIEITWKKIVGGRVNLKGIDLEGSNETILAVGGKVHEDITRFSVELSRESKSQYVSRVAKYNKKSFQYLTAFFMPTWQGDCKNMQEI